MNVESCVTVPEAATTYGALVFQCNWLIPQNWSGIGADPTVEVAAPAGATAIDEAQIAPRRLFLKFVMWT
jgi:hypothetical protein